VLLPPGGTYANIYVYVLIHTHIYIYTYIGRVQSAQEVFAINVDLYRNRVLRTTLVLTMISTSLASAATVGGR
jgi:hypothetical protein